MLPVYVMIGGRSSRFGRDKASHPVDGEPWALHVGRRLSGGNMPVLVGGEQPSGELGGCVWLPDATPPIGPLSGVLAALQDRQTRLGHGLLVLASCDLVRPRPEWLDALRAAHDERPDLEVAAYRAADRWQPFPSVVHTRWLDRLERAVAGGVRSLQEAFATAVHAPLPWPPSPWPDDGQGPPQANTPDDLARALAGDG